MLNIQEVAVDRKEGCMFICELENGQISSVCEELIPFHVDVGDILIVCVSNYNNALLVISKNVSEKEKRIRRRQRRLRQYGRALPIKH